MTPYLLANLAGLLLLACGALGLALTAVALLDGWQLVGAASLFAIASGVQLSRLDAPVGGER